MYPKNDLEQATAELLVATLNLDTPATDIDPTVPLFGDAGLGLDSIDLLELSLAISRQYGFQLRSDSTDTAQTFSSLRALCAHIEAHRAR
jgi:Acyl carrier protein